MFAELACQAVPTARSNVTPIRSADRLPGLMLGDYHLDRPIGRGGMGVVYSARDTTRDVSVAVKVLGNAIEEPEQFARFQREATTAARLRHPGIVRVFGVGQSDDVCYMAMELVDGVTLREWLTQTATQDTLTESKPTPPNGKAARSGTPTETQQFDPGIGSSNRWEDLRDPVVRMRPRVTSDPAYVQRVAEMLRELADALAHAHAAGVTHRDLKPENVMVRADGRVVVIDFGLARSFADATLTSHSGVMGTPQYMAPEQLTGQPATPSSDVYALGLIGYELLAHSLPFRAGTVERLLGEVLHKPPPPLTGRNPTVPPGLANIIHKAMAKKPADRYPTADALRADLDRYLAGGLVTARGYRYRFNPTTLLPVRPCRVRAVSCLNLLVSGCLLLAGMTSLMAGGWHGAWVFLIAAGCLYGGWRTPSGCRDGRFAGLTAVVSCTIAWFVLTFFDSGDVVSTDVSQLVGWGMAVVGCATATVLITSTARKWFRLTREKHQEFEAERGDVALSSCW